MLTNCTTLDMNMDYWAIAMSPESSHIEGLFYYSHLHIGCATLPVFIDTEEFKVYFDDVQVLCFSPSE